MWTGQRYVFLQTLLKEDGLCQKCYILDLLLLKDFEPGSSSSNHSVIVRKYITFAFLQSLKSTHNE